MMPILRQYESQFSYGEHCACICTIVCYRVAKTFLDARNNNNTKTKVMALLTTMEVHDAMLRSAQFYAGTDFAKSQGLMGMFDILRLIPLNIQKYSSLEFAGLLLPNASCDNTPHHDDTTTKCMMAADHHYDHHALDKKMTHEDNTKKQCFLDEDADNDLMLMSLKDLLQKIQKRKGTRPVALITTFDHHTIVFLSPGEGTLLMFDPAPAALYDISDHDDDALYKKAMQPYSATLLSRSVTASC